MTSPPRPPLSELSRVIHREVVLLAVLTGLAVAAFFVTQWAAAANRARQADDAIIWFERGRAALAAGRTAESVAALDRASARRADDWTYARVLAQALVADDQPEAARQVLLRWRRRRPEDADVNTQLARLEAGHGEAGAAVQYYESALHGRWPDPGDTSRLDLRRELIRFQLRRGLPGAALAQTLVLAANLPDEPAAHLETGHLFLEAGDPARALDHFARTLRLDPGNRDARAGVVAAAFERGDYPRVLASAAGLADRSSRERARIAASVMAADPLAPRLSFGERERRLAAAADDAAARFDQCRQRAPQATPLAERTATGLASALAAYRAELSPQRLRESSDVIERGLRLVGEVLALVRDRCPPLDARGDALIRMTQRHGSVE